MKYTITQGRIAAIQRIVPEVGRPLAVIYMGPENLRDAPDNRVFEVHYDQEVPVQVQAAVDHNFRTLFSVPVGQREALIKTLQAQEVEA